MRDGCPFCDYEGPSPILKTGQVVIYNAAGEPCDYHYFVIEPLNPVTPGHVLVISRTHVRDFRLHPWLLGALMQAAADLAGSASVGNRVDCNLIVSAGAEATQTVPHVHVHVVPRRENDGLKLPWGADLLPELLEVLSDEIVLHINAGRRQAAESLAWRLGRLGVKLPPSKYTCRDVNFAAKLLEDLW